MTRDGPAAILFLGNYRPTISLVRDLKRVGYLTIVGRGGGEGGAEYSRFADEVWDHPELERGGEAFLAVLRAFLERRPDVRVVFPVAESFVRIVSAARDRLPADRIYAVPPPDVVATALDKMAMWRLAQSLGVPVTPYMLAASDDELRGGCAELGYPVVIRPVDSTRRLGDAKALIAGSAEELARLLPEWPADHRTVLLQRCASGPRHNVYFAARAGRLVRILETVIERTDRPDDTGLAVEGTTAAPSPELRRFTEDLVAALRYSGVGCAQFLVDRAAGQIAFLELNPRIAGSHAIAEAAGLELGLLSILLATDDPPEVPFVEGAAGMVYAWTYGDMRGLLAAIAKGLPARAAVRWGAHLLRALTRSPVHLTWRWDDPLPTFVLFAAKVPLLNRLVGRRIAAPVASEPAARTAAPKTRPARV
ncbi:MAG TPA: hypothetical protein VKA21_01530 [Candidatus Binatia bacterium]|nr:hypothetical protein [Candidatus Binatia bacterium]